MAQGWRPCAPGGGTPRSRRATRWTATRPSKCWTGIVKLRLTVALDAQHGGFATGWSPVSWWSIDELFVKLTRRDHV